MKLKKWLENWDMISLKINIKFLEMEWQPKTADMDAAWDLYVEMLTRIATQPLPETHGDEKTALESVYQLFPLTREIIRQHGRDCSNFTKIAIVVLNQVVRPFTANWHRLSLAGAFDDPDRCAVFREELAVKQQQLREYTRMLADMAGVEDLTSLEDLA
ncbi:MAG: hypothetical protein ABFS39_15985 [Pseudomonadota bacterium]